MTNDKHDDSELKKACDEIQAKKQKEQQEEAERREAHKRKAEEAMAARGKVLARLREIGPGMSVPTHYKPHLLARKMAAKDVERPEHGVCFRRLGDDCLIEALNGIASVSICLQGEGKQCPELAIVPARALALVSRAEAEFAQLWFHDGKVTILVDDAIHEFFQIPRDLPFPTENLRAKAKGTRLLSSAIFDTEQLFRIQKALGAERVALRQADKHLLSVWPDGDDRQPSCGFLALISDES